jgi:hypothetical protein
MQGWCLREPVKTRATYDWDKAGRNRRNDGLEAHSKMKSWHMYFLVLPVVKMTVQ